MKILQVIESAGAGSGHQVLLSSRQLARRGAQIAVAYSDRRADTQFLSALTQLKADYPTTQVAVITMRREPHISDINAIFALRQFGLRAGPFDVIHSHCTKAGLLTRAAFPFSRRLQVYSPHAFLSMNPSYKPFIRFLIAGYERIMSALTDTVIAVSEAEYNHALDIGISPQKLCIVPNGVDLSDQSDAELGTQREIRRRELNIDKGRVCIGFLGRLAPQKDLGTLLRAFAQLRIKTSERPLLLICGGGPDEQMLKKLSKDLSIDDDDIRWTGPVDGPSILAAFDVFAMSSFYEGLSNSLLEAMRIHLPCVVTDTGGASELVQNGVNGFVVPVSNTTLLADALLTLVESTALRTAYGRASGEIVTSFDIVKTAEVMMTTLRSRHVLEHPDAGRSADALGNAPLRVLQVVESAATGVGRHVTDLTEKLIDRGHVVHLIYSSTNIDSRFESAVGKFKRNCILRPMKMSHRVGLGDIFVIKKIRNYLLRPAKFDVIHCHSSKAGLVARIAAFGTGVPVIYTPHAFFTMNPALSKLKVAAARAVELILSRLSARIISVSSEEYMHARRLGISEAILVKVPNGIDASEPLKRSESRGSADETVRIGFIGRLVQQKAVDHLLRAFASMRSSIGNEREALLLLAGDGPLKPQLSTLASSLGIERFIRWLGDADRRQILSQIDILAVPSDYEGFPYVMLEAMAASLPIVTTSVGGADELVHPGVNGSVVPCRDVDKFASALGKLVIDREARTRMGEQSHRIVQTFSSTRMGDDIIRVYRAVIAQTHDRNPEVEAVRQFAQRK